MTDFDLEKPALVAVWPGISGVAIGAGYYLLSKLGMTLRSEFSPWELFEVEHVDVEGGLIQRAELPRSRIFGWKDPRGLQDIVLFIGDAQPQAGKFAFCRRLIEQAAELGAERVFTFAAMATDMALGGSCRVFGAATDGDGLGALEQLGMTRLEEGRIGGLNGVLLAAAVERDMRGICLLGETPGYLANVLYPRASLAVLQAFSALTGVTIDLDELATQADRMEQKLGEAASKFEGAIQGMLRGKEAEAAAEEAEAPPPSDVPAQPTVTDEDRARLEELFEQAASDRSRAYELKRELDRLGLFQEYEDRFLDLFRNPDA